MKLILHFLDAKVARAKIVVDEGEQLPPGVSYAPIMEIVAQLQTQPLLVGLQAAFSEEASVFLKKKRGIFYYNERLIPEITGGNRIKAEIIRGRLTGGWVNFDLSDIAKLI